MMESGQGEEEIPCTCDPDACEYGCESPSCAQQY